MEQWWWEAKRIKHRSPHQQVASVLSGRLTDLYLLPCPTVLPRDVYDSTTITNEYWASCAVAYPYVTDSDRTVTEVTFEWQVGFHCA